jgi:type II secretory pathway component GspD/PulD (secretin)
MPGNGSGIGQPAGGSDGGKEAMVARVFSRIVACLAVSVALLYALGDLGSAFVQAQARTTRAHQQLTVGISSLRQGDYELAATFFQQAKAGEEDLSPTERQELASRLQFVEMALKSRQDGADQLKQAEAEVKANRTQEALALLRQLTTNQYLKPADKQRAQQLVTQLQPRGGALTPPTTAVQSTTGSAQLLRARTMLKNARGLLTKGEYDAAESLAKEANSLKLTYSSGEDTPQKLLDDVTRARGEKLDAKGLLANARAALERGDLDKAEQLAKQADKAEKWYSGLQVWADNPNKVLKDVQEARTRQPKDGGKDKAPAVADAKSGKTADKAPAVADAKAGKTVEKTPVTGDASGSKVPSKAPVVADAKGKTPAVADAKSKSPAANIPAPAMRETEAARQLIKQGRQAMQAKNFTEAEKLAKQARDKNPDLNWWDDTPDKLLTDLRRAQGLDPTKTDEVKQVAAKTVDKAAPVSADSKSGKTADKAPAVADAKTKSSDASGDPRELLRKARDHYEHGKLDDAKELALKANTGSVRWGLFEDSPDKLLNDIQKSRTGRNKDESAQLLAEARKLFTEGKLEEAEKKAYQAERLHGSYSIWDLGDRPQKLVAEIEENRARNRRNKVVAPPPVQVAVNDKKDQPPVNVQPKTDTVAKVAPKDVPPSNVQTPNAVVPTPPAAVVAQNNSSPLMGGTRVETPRPAADFNKQKAKQLLDECRQMQKQGRLAEALAKAKEAQQTGVAFEANEDRPELATQELAVLAGKQIDNLTAAALDYASQGQTDPASYGRAEGNLMQARGLAVAFGLDPQPIEGASGRIKQMQGVAAGPAAPNYLTQANHQPNEKRDRGLQLLDQSRMELRRGETATARRIAEEAFTGLYGVQQEAAAVLRSIDTEEFNVRLRNDKRKADLIIDAYRRKDFVQTKTLVDQLDMAQLAPDQRARLKSILESPELQPKAVAAMQRQPGVGMATTQGVVQASNNDTATAPAAGADNFAGQVQAMQEVKFQQMRADGIKAQQQAVELFNGKKPGEAIDVLNGYRGRLDDSGLDADKVTLLRRPVEARVQEYKKYKAQLEFEAVAKDAHTKAQNKVLQRTINEQEKKKQVAELMDKYKTFHKEGKYKEAEMWAMKAHEIDPDNAVTGAAVYVARVGYNQQRLEQTKKNNGDFDVHALRDSGDMGKYVNLDHPLEIDEERSKLAKSRGPAKGLDLRKKNAKEREIEGSLNKPITMSFDNKPLKDVIDELRDLTGVNIVTDTPALDEDGVSADRPISIKLENISMKSALNVLLHQVHLTYVIKDECLQITTEKHARGKLVQKTYPVADLIIPVDNYIVAPAANLMNVIGQQQQNNLNNNGVTPMQPRNGLQGGATVGSTSDSGSQNQPSGDGHVPANLKASTRAPGQTDTMHDLLIKLITSTIEPKSWSDVGGPATIDYFPLGMALVISQTPGVQEEVAQLLDALRQLQDLEVSVEVRMISLEESFYERIGIDFQMNIKTDRLTKEFEPQVVTQQFKPLNQINDPFPKSLLVGMTPAGSAGNGGSGINALTPDLDIPITNSSFRYAIPPFGGYPNIPGADGGLSMGLAFLSDIQVFMFMEAAQGDRRTNVLQAPKLTLFNGQTATIQIQDFQWFVTNVQVVQAGGQTTFVPQNQPIPMGINLAIQAVISADRRFVRLNIAPTMTNLASATVPLFPITTFITPVFEGGAQGQPVPFTQFIQQPTFTTVTIQTTVSVPDGGTVLLGGLKLMNEGRNEFGPPVLSKLPYINRLFKNVGYGRDTSSLLLMVTPRIIINSEEEFLQTGVGGPPGGQ